MKQLANLPRWARWAVPAGAMAVAGGVLAGSVIPAAQAAPLLPSRTPAQLLAALAGKTTAPPLTGTVVETASLGLPVLPSTGDPASLPSLLTGSHTIKVWYSDPAHYRLAVPQRMSESDVIRNGSGAWLWDSSTNTVTHVALPAKAVPPMPSMPLTPQQAAHQVLARVGPTTTVSVDRNVTVAGEAAYQLVLAPKSSGSLVGQVRIAIDARHNVPLRVQVFAKSATSPAIQVGFTSVSFVKPAAANFAFSPPAGARVTRESARSGSKASGQASRSSRNITNGFTVIGQGWLAVVALPQSALSSLAGTASPGGSGGSGLGPFRSSSQSAAPGSASPGGSGLPALGGDTGAIFGALLQSATRVSGPWGSGRLLRTSLLSVLITSQGRILIGAVTPDVLYQAATQTGHAPAARWHHAAAAATLK